MHLHFWDKSELMVMLTEEQKGHISKRIFGKWVEYDDWDCWNTSNIHDKRYALIKREFESYFMEYGYRDVNSDLCHGGCQGYDKLKYKGGI
ncbi:hypothetical protein ABR27_07855 [Enterobacter hormaechei subsp. hormaechei]|uniref:hypothetical protein n=1 Tax=Enterobacter hormaechei TaxID=158836 RepID=UPI0006433D42|nr:hypothetical protein ABR27_07855 [Enterobacter hormaechei subsp. hormaechei]